MPVVMLVVMLLPLPMAGRKAIAPVVLIPMLRHPMRAATFAHEMPVYPDVPMTVPAVIARSPDEPRSRRRHFNHTRCGRRDLDFDPGRRKCGRHGANEYRCRHGRQRKQGQSTSR
jgi:hypothetical protein